MRPEDRPPRCPGRPGKEPRASMLAPAQGRLLELQPARAVPARSACRKRRPSSSTSWSAAPQDRQARRGAVPRRRSLPVALCGAHRLLQDLRVHGRRARPGHRLPDGRRAARPRRHQPRPPHLRRGGAGGLAGLRDSLLAARSAVARVHRAAAPVPQDHEPRDRARPRRDAAAGQHAGRGAARGLPAQPGAAAAGARLLVHRRWCCA